MTYRIHPRVSAQDCSGRPQPGLVALAAVLEELWPAQANWGIYNCRKVRGSSSLSHHAEGRAYDCGIPLISGKANTKVGDPICRALLENAWELGIDHVIWNRRQWTAKYPDGAAYSGSNPTLRHEDHIHVGMTWTAARTMTADTIRNILQGEDMNIDRNAKADDGLPIHAPAVKKAIKAGAFSEHTQPGGVAFNDEIATFLDRLGLFEVAQRIAALEAKVQKVQNQGGLKPGTKFTAEVK